jgi:HK97 family phage prohead protease
MPKPVSIDEFLDKRSLTVRDGVVYKAAKMPKSFDQATRSAVFVMTDETTDSYGDTVRAKGADLTRFDTNPICLLNHRSDLILGTWSDVQNKAKRIEGRATLASEGTAPHVDMAYNLMSQGILRAASIGFMPKKLERKLDDKGEPTWAYDILEWELYECSIVSIPANPAALAKSVKDGNMLARDFLEEVLDTYERTAAGLIVPKSELESAHKDATGNRTTLAIEAPEWLGEVRALTERMEAAVKAAGEPIVVAHVVQDPVVDEVAKELEDSVEAVIKGIEPKVDELPEDQVERKGALTKLLDGIRSLFKADEPEKTDPVIEPEKADAATKEALRKQFDEIASRHDLAA